MKTVEIVTSVSALRARRLEVGISLNELARRIGATSAYVSGLETGKQGNPSIRMCVRLAHELDVDMGTIASWFVDEEVTP